MHWHGDCGTTICCLRPKGNALCECEDDRIWRILDVAYGGLLGGPNRRWPCPSRRPANQRRRSNVSTVDSRLKLMFFFYTKILRKYPRLRLGQRKKVLENQWKSNGKIKLATSKWVTFRASEIKWKANEWIKIHWILGQFMLHNFGRSLLVYSSGKWKNMQTIYLYALRLHHL